MGNLRLQMAAVPALAMILASWLDACSLPDPSPGHPAHVRDSQTITSGAAFGVSTGMTEADAHRVLDRYTNQANADQASADANAAVADANAAMEASNEAVGAANTSDGTTSQQTPPSSNGNSTAAPAAPFCERNPGPTAAVVGLARVNGQGSILVRFPPPTYCRPGEASSACAPVPPGQVRAGARVLAYYARGSEICIETPRDGWGWAPANRIVRLNRSATPVQWWVGWWGDRDGGVTISRHNGKLDVEATETIGSREAGFGGLAYPRGEALIVPDEDNSAEHPCIGWVIRREHQVELGSDGCFLLVTGVFGRDRRTARHRLTH